MPYLVMLFVIHFFFWWGVDTVEWGSCTLLSPLLCPSCCIKLNRLSSNCLLGKKKFLIYCLFHMVYFNEWSRLLLFIKSAFDLNWITMSNYLAIINAWELCFWLWLIYAFDLNVMPFIKYIIFHLQIRRLLLVCMAWIAWPVW